MTATCGYLIFCFSAIAQETVTYTEIRMDGSVIVHHKQQISCEEWVETRNLDQIKLDILQNDFSEFYSKYYYREAVPRECIEALLAQLIEDALQKEGRNENDDRLIAVVSHGLVQLGKTKHTGLLWKAVENVDSYLDIVLSAYIQLAKLDGLENLATLILDQKRYSVGIRLNMYADTAGFIVCYGPESRQWKDLIRLFLNSIQLEDDVTASKMLDKMLNGMCDNYNISIQRREIARRFAKENKFHPDYEYFRRIQVGFDTYPPEKWTDVEEWINRLVPVNH